MTSTGVLVVRASRAEMEGERENVVGCMREIRQHIGISGRAMITGSCGHGEEDRLKVST